MTQVDHPHGGERTFDAESLRVSSVGTMTGVVRAQRERRGDRPLKNALVPHPVARGGARRVASLVLALCALAGFTAAPADEGILFAADTVVPPAVQAFAWRVIETRCNYQPDERRQRSFWAYGTRARRVDDAVVYSITILSELPRRKTEPPAVIEMTIAEDGGIRLTALRSAFVTCE
jgi:hypothetical protein